MLLTERDCLRNVQRRTGRPMPPTPESIAKPLTDEELADLIHGLGDILDARLNAKRRDGGSWLKVQLDNASLTVRSWPTNKQNAMKGCL